MIPAALTSYIAGLKAHDVDRIASTVAEELAFVSSGRTLNKPEFLAMLRALYAAFPDWQYDHDPPETVDGTYAVKWRQSGNHSGTFHLPGLDPISPTGRTVTIPEQYFFYKVGEQILEIRPDPIAGGAPAGILEQIGAAGSSL